MPHFVVWTSRRGYNTPRVTRAEGNGHMGRNQIGCALALMVSAVAVAGCGPKAQGWNSTLLKNELVELRVVPEIGGRIIQYKLGQYGFFWVNRRLLDVKPPPGGLGPEGAWLNYGGDKLWPAPQGWDNDRQWPGPPDAVLDGGPYSAKWTRRNDRAVAVELTSGKDKRSGIQFSRVVRIFEGTTRVGIDATMTNIDTKPRRWGIWAHTQFDAGNRHGPGHNPNYWACCPLNPESVFPRGYDVLFGLVNNASFKPDYKSRMMRVHYERRVGKIGLDSRAGWVATVDATDGYVFVQRFTHEPGKAYPEQSSVEFWLNGLGEFVAWGKINKMSEDPQQNPYNFESEVLSPYAALAPGESYTFHYDWYAAKIPPGSPVVHCNDVGITCERLAAEVKAGALTLKGKFGVFHRGRAQLVFLDRQGRQTGEAVRRVSVTPLEPLDLSRISGPAVAVRVPTGAEKVAVILYDQKGNRLGELARASLRH